MNLETIELTKQNKIAVIKLNRPELLNAVNEQLVWDLQKATEQKCIRKGMITHSKIKEKSQSLL